MKRFGLFLCLGLLVGTLSCTKEKGLSPSDFGEGDRDMVELTFNVATAQTKAIDASMESGVESLLVFVFSDGKLEAVGSSDSDSLTIRCFKGDKDIFAVVNYSSIEWHLGMADSDLMETVFELTEKEGLNAMFGSKSVSSDMFLSSSSLTVEMEVKRVAARFVLKSVINDIPGNGTVTVHSAYLTNVVADVGMDYLYSGSSYTPEVWYNKTQNDWDLEKFLYSGKLEETIVSGESHDFNQYFYCYPNPTTTDSHDLYFEKLGWTHRFTRLVVEAEYEGENEEDNGLCYYVLSISGVRNNFSYEVTYVITGPGGVNPEDQDDTFNGDFGHEGGDGDTGDNDDDDDRKKDPGTDDPLNSATRALGDEGVAVRLIGGFAKVKECGL